MGKLFKDNTDKFFDSAKQSNPALEELRGIIKYRDLIFQLIYRDVVARYKRSVLGVAWTMLNPLGTMAIISIVFSQVFHTVQGYPTYVLAGIVAWNFFAQTTTASMQQIIWGGSLFHRIYLPRTTFIVAAVGTGLVNLILSMIPLGIIMLATKITFTKSLFILPISILLLAAFALGIGLFFSSLVIYFPDVTEMYQIALTAWMYFTPIFYPKEILPAALQRWVLYLNPMYYLVQIFRIPIFEGKFPELHELLLGSAISLLTLIIGWHIFSKRARKIAYYA